MNDNPWRAPRPSDDAMQLMALLLRRGGGMRIGPLLRISHPYHDALVAAANELIERLWVEVVWLGDRASRSNSVPERFREVRRVVTTRTGRHCYPLMPKF
jgi:hypothetical protein